MSVTGGVLAVLLGDLLGRWFIRKTRRSSPLMKTSKASLTVK